MPRKRPFVASLDQVRITRDGEVAIIEYADADVWTTNFELGPGAQSMSDQEILDRWNRGVEATEDLIAEYEHECVEIPPGRPQIQWDERCQTWTMRGEVLRGQVGDDEHRNPTVEIDGRELTWEEFGQMVVVNAGWGFRLCIVPDDETHERPTIVVRDSDDADA